MRINVYSQELTGEVALVDKTADTGITYFGVRMYLASPTLLHHTPDDDDRSAITFWIPDSETFGQDDLADTFRKMSEITSEAPEVDTNE